MSGHPLLHAVCDPRVQAAAVAAAGAALLIGRHYRSALAALALAAAWLYLCATPAASALLRAGLESRFPHQPPHACTRADAIVVFGGDDVPGTGADWQDTAIARRRIGYAYQLYRQGCAPLLVLAGGHGGAAHMAAALSAQGVPAAALRLDERSQNTHENARYSAVILRREDLRRVLLVTSPIHMPRALASLTREGIGAIPAAAMPMPDPPSSQPWMPQRTALRRTERCLHEYIGLWVYRLRGWA